MLGNHSNKKKTKWGRRNLAWGTMGELLEPQRCLGGEPSLLCLTPGQRGSGAGSKDLAQE